MKYKKVKSFEHLDELLAKHVYEFAICRGILRSSKDITKKGDKYAIFNYIDDSEDLLTLEELKEENIGKAIVNGNFYYLSNEDD